MNVSLASSPILRQTTVYNGSAANNNVHTTVRKNAAANNYCDKGFITFTKLAKRSVVLLTIASFQQVSFNW
jgi:hypothetical protein